MIPTGESIVFLSKDGSVFTKMKSPFSKAPLKQTHPEDIIYEHLIHNMLFPKEDKYFYGNEYLAITDISNLSDNVLCDENGKLFFIDPIIRLKRPAQEVWDYLYNSRCI